MRTFAASGGLEKNPRPPRKLSGFAVQRDADYENGRGSGEDVEGGAGGGGREAGGVEFWMPLRAAVRWPPPWWW